MEGEEISVEAIAEEFIESEHVKPAGEEILKAKVIRIVTAAEERGRVEMRERCAVYVEYCSHLTPASAAMAERIRAMPTTADHA